MHIPEVIRLSTRDISRDCHSLHKLVSCLNAVTQWPNAMIIKGRVTFQRSMSIRLAPETVWQENHYGS